MKHIHTGAIQSAGTNGVRIDTMVCDGCTAVMVRTAEVNGVGVVTSGWSRIG